MVLLGGGGHASDALGAIEAHNAELSEGSAERITVVGIVAEDPVDMRRFSHRGVEALGKIEDLPKLDVSHFHAAVGYPKGRIAVAKRALGFGLEPVTVVHPRAWVPPGVHVGAGSLVLAGACVSPGASFGRFTYISHGALIGHDCQVEDFVSVLPGAAVNGDTRLGEGCTIGSNATVIEGKTVGERAIVGAGAVVTADIPPGVTAVGIPARPRPAS
jgi:sugar O-acyltransferase (sialic acid O-acetyltransferase NeuD family)